MTPVFCCGFECGVSGAHFTLFGVGGSESFSTAQTRSGARALRASPTANVNASGASAVLASTNVKVLRLYVYFATLPTADTVLISFPFTSEGAGVRFKQSDASLYTFAGAALGASGVVVTTGQWYRIDVAIDATTNPWTVDAKVNGAACAQLTNAVAGDTSAALELLVFNAGGITADVGFDDVVVSHTAGDYPIGAGYVNHFVPTSDGSHNVAGTNDFERTLTGTDINNATTTAFQLIDDVPLETGAPTDFINLIAPPNSTDYVEVVFGPASGISTPTAAPRAVEVVGVYASSATGTNNLRLALNDNGSLDDVFNGNAALTTTNCKYVSKHYVDPPSAASAWTLSGNGNFNNIRMRCFTSDAAPDPYFVGAMIEAEFEEVVGGGRTTKNTRAWQLGQNVGMGWRM